VREREAEEGKKTNLNSIHAKLIVLTSKKRKATPAEKSFRRKWRVSDNEIVLKCFIDLVEFRKRKY
jgi:hypothetical protein